MLGNGDHGKVGARRGRLRDISGFLEIECPFAGIYLVSPTSNHRKYGVPPGGPFDRESAALANILCKNLAEAPLLEVSVSEVILRIPEDGDRVSFAVVGAGAQYRSILSAATEIKVSPRGGERVYVSWCGLAIDSELESRQLLGTHRFQASNDSLELAELSDAPSSLLRKTIRFLPGPHFKLLGCPTEFDAEVGNNRSRVGIRTSSGFSPHIIELPSEPCQVGTIQVTPSGEVLFLGPDGPTTGGYPKLGYVFDADLDKLGQLTLGDRLKLIQGSINEAIETRRLARLNSFKVREILQIL